MWAAEHDVKCKFSQSFPQWWDLFSGKDAHFIDKHVDQAEEWEWPEWLAGQ